MPEQRLTFQGGVNLEATQTSNRGGWSDCNLVRFKGGFPEKYGGWVGISEAMVGVCRALHFWSDLIGATRTAGGTNSHLYLLGEPNIDITPAGYIPGPVSSSDGDFSLQLWGLDNFGQDLIAISSHGPIYFWVPPAAVPAVQILAAPGQNFGGFVAMQLQVIIAYGCTPLTGGDEDPMLVRWCDQGDFNDWTASTTNQAGSYRIPRGNRIVGGLQTPLVELLWTDFALWSVQYIGFPLVFNFTEIGENCGLIGQKAAVMVGTIPYWMSDHGFYRGAGEQIPCTVWDFVFKDLDMANQDKCVAGADALYSEVIFYFPSASGGTGEIDSYVKLNLEENKWDKGKLARTAWTDANRPGPPIAVDLAGILQQHDTGVDDDGVAMTDVFIQSGYVDVEDGGAEMLINRLIPDFMFTGSAPGVGLDVTLLFRNYPGDTPTEAGPFHVTLTTEFITLTTRLANGAPSVGVRAREIAIKISSDEKGVFWRMGTPRTRHQIDGRL